MKHFDVLRKWCKKIEIEIFDKWLITLDHVTYTQNQINRVKFTSCCQCVFRPLYYRSADPYQYYCSYLLASFIYIIKNVCNSQHLISNSPDYYLIQNAPHPIPVPPVLHKSWYDPAAPSSYLQVIPGWWNQTLFLGLAP